MTTMLEKMAQAHCEKLSALSGEDYMRWDALGPSMQAWEIEATRAALLALQRHDSETRCRDAKADTFSMVIDAILAEEPA